MRKILKLLPISQAEAAKVADVLGSIPMREFVATTLFLSTFLIVLPFGLLALSVHDAWM